MTPMMKFLVDRMLGKLAKQIRMLGYDAVYYSGGDPEELLQMARREGRTILTRNTKLRPRRTEDRLVCVKEDAPLRQIRELIGKGVIQRRQEHLFSRCLLCNARLEAISRKEADGKVPDFVFHSHEEFFRCPECRRIYWKGSHQQNMEKRVEELFQSVEEGNQNSNNQIPSNFQ